MNAIEFNKFPKEVTESMHSSKFLFTVTLSITFILLLIYLIIVGMATLQI